MLSGKDIVVKALSSNDQNKLSSEQYHRKLNLYE